MRYCVTLLLALGLASQTWALAPEYEVERLLMAAEENWRNGEQQRLGGYLQRVEALPIESPPLYFYLYGQWLQSQERFSEAREALEKYVELEGREGRFFTEALGAINQLEERQAEPVVVEPEPLAQLNWGGGEDTSSQVVKPTGDFEKNLMALYLTDNAEEALLWHINSLLTVHPFIGEKIQRSDAGERFSLVRQSRGQLLTQKEHWQDGRALDGKTAMERFSVYGVNPYVSYECESLRFSCWILHPVDQRQWLRIANHPDTAQELSRSVSLLLRRMQQ